MTLIRVCFAQLNQDVIDAPLLVCASKPDKNGLLYSDHCSAANFALTEILVVVCWHIVFREC